jgi:hypothetical protein
MPVLMLNKPKIDAVGWRLTPFRDILQRYGLEFVESVIREWQQSHHSNLWSVFAF